ncbi:dipeptide ABC transporter ATP-binding protein [Ancylobacter moscoviensis]
MGASPPLLELRDLRIKGPGGIDILKGVSFSVVPGEIVALVGESGSGKTMAARSVLRLLPPNIRRSGGAVLFEGRDIDALSEKQMRALRGGSIGMVLQEPMVSLNPAMTIGAQLVEALKLHRGLATGEALDAAEAMLARVRIADPRGCLASHPHQFSGGMRQRIMLASVMLLKPRLLIADEPTTALDTLSQREVLSLMVELTRSVNTAVLLITHNLGLVAQYAGRAVVLERGDLVEAGPVAEVLQHPREAYTRALIDALPRRDESRPPVPPTPPLIEARDVSVRYPGGGFLARREPKLAVNAVSLSVRPGEVVALVGGSGSGKTTLGRAMAGLVPLAGGRVRFRGRDVAGASRREARDFRLDAQVIFQDPYSSLDPHQRIGDIVGEPLWHVPGMGRRERVERVGQMLAEVGLAAFADRYPHALSGGQRQRVAIARAVVRNPAFVVADEPVSALDMTIQKQVLELIRRLQAQHGFACLFISQDLGAVAQVSDRIVVMREGRIVEEGSVSGILDTPREAYTRELIAATSTLEMNSG